VKLLMLAIILLRHPEIPTPPAKVERRDDPCSSMCLPECARA